MKILAKENLADFITLLQSKSRLMAPVKQPGQSLLQWALVDKPGEVEFGFVNSSLSPKNFFLPQSETLMTFVNDPAQAQGFIMEPAPLTENPTTLLNIRPCDAKALQILDLIFVQDELTNDVYWQSKRRQTALLGLACNDPCPSCFCASMNCGPHHEEGLDVLLVDLGDKLLLKPLTAKGEELSAGLKSASDLECKQAAELKRRAEASFNSTLSLERISQRPVLELYDLPFWNQVQETCLNCGVCTFTCPTCHCFDIQDETSGTAGRRVRNWDYCMSRLFTLHGTGHNPRGQKTDRVRQRFMHKFKYIPEKRNGHPGCVGCGRCVISCPVNIDVRQVVAEMNA